MPRKQKKKRRGHYNRGEYTSLKSGVTYKHRSGWELLVMQHLDASSDVTSWTYEQVVIEYVSNIRSKKIRRYYPDFFVIYSDGRQELLEVKPKRKLEQVTVKKKARAALLWCVTRGITYRILTEVDLKEAGLL